MNNQFKFAFALGVVLVGLIFLSDGVFGHSYVTSPASRSNQKQTQTGCRGPSCLGPCDKPASQKRSPITVQRGQSLNIQWPRNNHAGGFIRIAWAPTDQSDSHSAFDNNVQEIACHERGGCKPDNANDPNGGDSAPADGSRQPCQLSVVVPPHLTDGLWTLQWAWFGGAYQLGDYYSCVDYQISGGASGSKPAAFFLGGDYTYPNQQKCKFFNTDRLHQCVNEPCNNPVYSLGERSGPAFGVGSNPSPSPSPTPTPSPTPSPTPVTTRRASTTTTTSTSSTGRASTSTSTSSGSNNGAMCYLPGTPNLGGKINSLNTCGRKSPRARCAEGQCCSQWGYCGPVKAADGTYREYVDGKSKVISEAFAFQLYCNKTSGDYRKVPCNSIQTGVLASNFEDKQTGASNSLMNVQQIRYLLFVGIAMTLLVAFLF